MTKCEAVEETVIDGTGLILGRAASIIAKRLLNGERIVLVNSEKMVISGSKYHLIEDYKKKLEVRSLRSVEKNPQKPRRPDTLVRRVIRGMLPIKKFKGRQAFKRLRVYIGVPEEYEGKQTESIPEAHCSKLRCKYITVGDFLKHFGWRE